MISSEADSDKKGLKLSSDFLGDAKDQIKLPAYGVIVALPSDPLSAKYVEGPKTKIKVGSIPSLAHDLYLVPRTAVAGISASFVPAWNIKVFKDC